MFAKQSRRCRAFVVFFFACLIAFSGPSAARAVTINWRYFVNGTEVFEPHPNHPSRATDGDPDTAFFMDQNNQGGSATSELTVRAEFSIPVFLIKINGRLGGDSRIDNGEDDQKRTGLVEVGYFIAGTPTANVLFSFADGSNGHTQYDSGDLNLAVKQAEVEAVEWHTRWGDFCNNTIGEGRLFTSAFISETQLQFVPEPSSIFLAAFGAFTLFVVARRRRTAQMPKRPAT